MCYLKEQSIVIVSYLGVTMSCSCRKVYVNITISVSFRSSSIEFDEMEIMKQ